MNNYSRNRGDLVKPMMYSAICSECGNNCQVPFRPSGDRPIYCSNCFENKRDRNSGSSPGRNFGRPNFADRGRDRVVNDNGRVLRLVNALDAKLDRIIRILEPKNAEKQIPVSPLRESVTEEHAPETIADKKVIDKKKPSLVRRAKTLRQA